MNLNEVVLFFMLYKYEILLIIFIPFLVFLIFWAFPRIEKKFNEKDLIKDIKALEKALWPKEPKQVIRVSIKEIK